MADKIIDTENHGQTSIIVAGANGKGRKAGETTVWRFGDIRLATFRIYRGGEGLDWAITDLVKRTNSTIQNGRASGSPLNIGDIVQASVYAYYFENDQRVRKPRTTEDSPAFGSLPYEICLAPEGYWTARPALPPETLIHFKIPVYVGELIKSDENGNLLNDAQKQALQVTLQLKEAQRIVDDADFERREKIDSEKSKFTELAGKIDQDVADLFSGLKEEYETQAQQAPKESDAERLKRRLSSLDSRGDFGFR